MTQATGAIHAAKMDSPRLQRMLALLQRGGRYTTMDVIIGAKVCAVNSIAAELRENGVPVHCKRNGDVWEYWLD